MHALFLVAFFSLLVISNFARCKLSDIGDPLACFLTLSSVPFIPQGALLHITCTKTLQFQEHMLELHLPLIPGSH